MAVKRQVSKPMQRVKLIEQNSTPLALFAICSTENGYRLSWLLNIALSINLQRCELSCDEFPDDICKFDAFVETQAYGGVLITNKIAPTKFISSSYKKFDYLFCIRHSISDADIIAIETTIKHISGVITLVKITNPDKKVIELLNLF
jgi:hypothetical protein